jgi:hypothetical protein
MEYYVYAYMDPRFEYNDEMNIGLKFEPIYIGKGKKSRLYHHWNTVKKNKNLRNHMFNSRLYEIKNLGLEPIIIKIHNNLADTQAKCIEIDIISSIGKYMNGSGTLLNISDGGDGGITWIGECPFKGKTLEELYGKEKSDFMKMRLSEEASLRIGEKNPMWGRIGDNSPISGINHGLYGKNHSEESRKKISYSVKEWISKLSDKEKSIIIEKIKESKEKWDNNKKENIFKKISDSLSGRKFTESHRINLSSNNYRNKNKGNPELKCSDECKSKISDKLKGRVFSDDHRNKLKKFFISYEDLKKMVQSSNIKSKRMYQDWIKINDIKAPLNPGYKNYAEKWEGWVIFLGKNKI